MMKRLIDKIEYWIEGVVQKRIVIGGHCGLCGKWVDDCLVSSYWRVTICKKCAETDGA